MVNKIELKTVPVEVVVIDLDIEINADREQVFTALTGSTALWWGRDFVESKTTSDVILEPRLGGRLYERWGRLGHDSHGAIHATVTAMHRPQLLRLSGPFGLTKKAVQAVLVFELTEESDMKTKLSLSYQAVGNIDEETKGKYLKGWQDLLDRFKTFVEQDGQALRRDPGQGDTGVHFHL